MNLAGIADIQLSVTDFPRSRAFYRALCEHFEMQCQYDDPGSENERPMLYYIGGKTGVLIRPVNPEHAGARFHQYKPGLHHLCFRARSRVDIDAFHAFFAGTLAALGGKLVHAPEEGAWASGYYSILFEDPDGIRLEINHVPGKGNLAEGVQLPLADRTSKRVPQSEDSRSRS
ncbi:VOC family protein [Sorangium sp. So ce362]|uniref:VOC family protein n=1 Tax=Sorangium sp. So ce362 TaxID=3133303 RepID=UPI003F61B82F